MRIKRNIFLWIDSSFVYVLHVVTETAAVGDNNVFSKKKSLWQEKLLVRKTFFGKENVFW